jgi:hypothetical protein
MVAHDIEMKRVLAATERAEALLDAVLSPVEEE